MKLAAEPRLADFSVIREQKELQQCFSIPRLRCVLFSVPCAPSYLQTHQDFPILWFSYYF